MFSLTKAQPPIPGGRYYENGKWVDANGESIEPEIVTKKLEDQIAELNERLSALKEAIKTTK